MKMVMRSLFGERWFYDECAKKTQRRDEQWAPTLARRTVIGHDRVIEQVSISTVVRSLVASAISHYLLARSIRATVRTVVVVLRHPVALFVEEFAYIRSELRKANPSLQFVQDQTLRDAMKMGMTLEGYAAYPHEHHDWHGAATNRQAFYLTGLPVPPPLSAYKQTPPHFKQWSTADTPNKYGRGVSTGRNSASAA